MAERFKKSSRIFELALSDAIQSHSKVHTMEKGPARCITREAKIISPAEDQMQHFTSKPKVKQKKSSNFVLRHDPKSSLPPRRYNSKHCHASYQSSCESSGTVSDIESISSEDYQSKKDSFLTSRTLAPVKDKDCISSIYALPISFCEIKRSGIGCDNPATIDPPSFNRSILNKSKELYSLSTEDHFASLPQKVSMQVGFSTSEVYECPTAQWDIPSKLDSSSSAPKSSESFTNSFFFPRDIESSNGEFSIPSPKVCNRFSNSAIFTDKICPVNCDTDIPNPKGCDSNPFFTFPDQMHSACYDALIPPPKSCGSKSFPLTDQTRTENCDTIIPSLDIHHRNSFPFTNVTDFETVIPNPKSCHSNYFSSANQTNLGTDESTIPIPKSYNFFNSFPLNVQTSSTNCEATIPSPKSHVGDFYPFHNPMLWTDQKIPSPKSYKSFPNCNPLTSKIYSANCDTDIFSPSQPLDNCGLDVNESIRQKPAGIYASSRSTSKRDSIPSKKEHILLSHYKQDMPDCNINIAVLKDPRINGQTIPSLVNDNNNDQSELALMEQHIRTCDVFPDGYLDELIKVGTMSLDNSINELDSLANKNPESDITPLSINYKHDYLPKSACKINKEIPFETYGSANKKQDFKSRDVTTLDHINLIDFEETLDTHKNGSELKNSNVCNVNFGYSGEALISDSDSNCDYRVNHSTVNGRTLHPVKSHFDLLSIEPNSNSDSWINQSKVGNFVTPVKSQFDLLSIEPKVNSDSWINQLKEINFSTDQSHFDPLNTEPINDTNYSIDQLKVNRTVSPAQNHLNDLFAEPKSHSAVLINEPCLSEQNDSSNSGFYLNKSKSKNSLKANRIMESRKEFFKGPSKSIDSGLGFLSEENLAYSSSDIPSALSELNISSFTQKGSPVEDLDKNKVSHCYEEEYSTPLQSSDYKLDAYAESEKERIDNLIDQFIGM